MQSLKVINNFGIKKDMDLAQLMSVVANNLHGESTIQIQEFKKSSKANVNPQLYDFFPLKENGDLKTSIISGFGISSFLDIIRNSKSEVKNKMLRDAYIDEDRTVYHVPDVKVNVSSKDYCRFFSIKNKKELEDKITKNYYNDRDQIFPRIQGMGYRRVEDTEFTTNNIRREIQPQTPRATSFSQPNIFVGIRSLKELEQLLTYFGRDNFHKVVACNEEQGYALVHKITVRVDFPNANYFQLGEDSDLGLDVHIEIFHQYFLSGRNDEGGYFITAVVFPDPDMLFSLIRTQDFKPFLTWFNREDQGYKRIQGDILYKIISAETDIDKHETTEMDHQGINTTFANIPLDTLYYDYLDQSDSIPNYEFLCKYLMENRIKGGLTKPLRYEDLGKIEKHEMKPYIGERNFNFSHHNIRSFGSKKCKLTNHIQIVSKERINQYILVYGATRCILEHEQHEARAVSIPKDSILLISHQRGKDITNLFAD